MSPGATLQESPVNLESESRPGDEKTSKSKPNDAESITATLTYAEQDFERGYFYARPISAEDKHTSPYGGKVKNVEQTIHNARGKGCALDTHSFELVEHTTTLSTNDFYEHPEKITSIYYEEIKLLLKKETGCSDSNYSPPSSKCREE